MKVTALAEAVSGSRSHDGVFSLHRLQSRLPHAGLEEFDRAVAALIGRVNLEKQETGLERDPEVPWV